MSKATITVLGERAEVERQWNEQDPLEGATAVFQDAPGDRGTEIHVEYEESGGVAGLVSKATGSDPRAKAMDALRHFKARLETGEVPRSDASPEGERAERKLKQRPAQPLEESEREKAGV
jgi:uncharacterized membrane protein